MQNPFFPIVICLCISMFFIKREYKIAILYFSMMILFSVPKTYPGGKIFTLPMCFFLSELVGMKWTAISLKNSKLWIPLTMIVIATIILCVTSPHYQSVIGLFRLFNKELICKYFYLAYAFICIYNTKSLKPFLNLTYYSVIIMTILGVINLITRHSHFLDIAMIGGEWNDILADMGGKYEFKERFRVQSTFFNAFCYGYICVMNLLLFMYAHTKKMVSLNQYHIVVAGSLFGIIFCGCRTILVIAVAGYFVYIFMTEKLSLKIKYFIAAFFISVFSYQFIKPVEKLVDSTLFAFDKDYKIEGGGSSIEMRSVQFARVLYYVKDHPVFGRGKDFFREDLGYKNGKSGLLDRDLHGLEGVVLSLLLERGVVGVFFYFFFIILMLWIIWEYRDYDRNTTAFAVAILTSYTLFANATGELASFPPTFVLIGCVLGMMYHQRRKEKLILLLKN